MRLVTNGGGNPIPGTGALRPRQITVDYDTMDWLEPEGGEESCDHDWVDMTPAVMVRTNPLLARLARECRTCEARRYAYTNGVETPQQGGP